MKKIFPFLIFMFVFPMFTSQPAWAGLDAHFDYMNIPTESFDNIYFRKSTLADVKAKYPKFTPVKMDDGSTILSYKPKSGIYSEIRIGFAPNNQTTLEWIEFILKEKQSIDKILSRYGLATEVNSDYNNLYNYYNYEYFNFSVDKQQQYFYSVSIFENPKLPDELANFDQELPDLNNLAQIKNFVPKSYPEEAFGDYYESIYPQFNQDGSKTYTINGNVIQKYKKAELIFDDGLLKFLVLYPNNLNFSQIKSIYGNCTRITSQQNQIVYDYGNFAVITNLSNQVLKIAID